MFARCTAVPYKDICAKTKRAVLVLDILTYIAYNTEADSRTIFIWYCIEHILTSSIHFHIILCVCTYFGVK